MPTRISAWEYAFDTLFKFDDQDPDGVAPVVYKPNPAASPDQAALWQRSKNELHYQITAVALGHPIQIYACNQKEHTDSDGHSEPIVYSQPDVLFLQWMSEPAAMNRDCVKVSKFVVKTPASVDAPDLPASWSPSSF